MPSIYSRYAAVLVLILYPSAAFPLSDSYTPDIDYPMAAQVGGIDTNPTNYGYNPNTDPTGGSGDNYYPRTRTHHPRVTVSSNPTVVLGGGNHRITHWQQFERANQPTGGAIPIR
jgi:hypothetical protein